MRGRSDTSACFACCYPQAAATGVYGRGFRSAVANPHNTNSVRIPA